MSTLKKLFFLLNRSEKKKIYLLLLLVLIMTFFDVVGISSIAPFVALLSDPQLIETNFILTKIYKFSIHYFGINSKENFVVLFGTAVFFLLIFSIIIRAFTIYSLTRFSLMREHSIGKKLIEIYLRQPYIWFLNKNTSELGKSILSEVQQVIDWAFVPALNLVAHSIVALALLTLSIYTNPYLSIKIGIAISLFYLFIFFLIKKFLTKIGGERLKANERRFNVVLEAFGASKLVKFSNLENYYINLFSKHATVYSRNSALAVIFALIPRYLIEAMAIGGMIILIIFFVTNGNSLINLLPTIALYSFVAYRLIPIMHHIYSSMAKLRFSRVALDSLYNDLKNLENNHLNEVTNLENNDQNQNNFESVCLKKFLDLKNIKFSYPNSDRIVLDNISLSIKAFSKVGIAGATGSGKTTLIDIILGLLDYNEGSLKIDGLDINYKNKRLWQNAIGYVPQQIYLSDKKIYENIAFGVDPKKIDFLKVKEVCKIAKIDDFILNKLTDGYDTLIGERGVRLSGGEKQRLGIARALYHNPKLLIFDEATSALDNTTEREVLKGIDELRNKITIIMVAHRLVTLQNCDMIFLLDKGKLISKGTYQELCETNPAFMKNSDFFKINN